MHPKQKHRILVTSVVLVIGACVDDLPLPDIQPRFDLSADGTFDGGTDGQSGDLVVQMDVSQNAIQVDRIGRPGISSILLAPMPGEISDAGSDSATDTGSTDGSASDGGSPDRGPSDGAPSVDGAPGDGAPDAPSGDMTPVRLNDVEQDKVSFNRNSTKALAVDSQFAALRLRQRLQIDRLTSLGAGPVLGLDVTQLKRLLIDEGDVLRIDASQKAGTDYLAVERAIANSFGGRALTDDVLDTTMNVLTYGAVTGDGVAANDLTFLPNFPFLAPAHQVCPPSYAGCTSSPDTFVDMTGKVIVNVAYRDFSYEPRCVRVTAGTSITFSGPGFARHPITQACGQDVKIVNPATGNQFTITFSNPGVYGYFCSTHGRAFDGLDMAGLIEVVP